jgi:hypothetical protein
VSSAAIGRGPAGGGLADIVPIIYLMVGCGVEKVNDVKAARWSVSVQPSTPRNRSRSGSVPTSTASGRLIIYETAELT